MRNCWLQGLSDLAAHTEYVRQKTSEYLNDLISLGVAGEFKFIIIIIFLMT